MSPSPDDFDRLSRLVIRCILCSFGRAALATLAYCLREWRGGDS